MTKAIEIEKTLWEQIADEMLARLSRRVEFEGQSLEAIRRAVECGDLKNPSKVAEAITPKGSIEL
ncbi:MAG: hypothetical protein NT002_00375 [candidate division Zixibacteria bacterium]|nr:hypothetical protein [candidate division Zixibacteria bacterium]